MKSGLSRCWIFIRAHEQNPYVWADTMFAALPNQIVVIDKTTLTVTHVITDGLMTLHPELTDDGQFVYISDWQGKWCGCTVPAPLPRWLS